MTESCLVLAPIDIDATADLVVRIRAGYVCLYYLLPAFRDRGLGVHLDSYATAFLKGHGERSFPDIDPAETMKGMH